jgi:hypothetical protein
VIDAMERGTRRDFDAGGFDESGPRPDSSSDRRFLLRGSVNDEWGRSESFDPDDVGDIADEGAGHRG